MNHPHEIVCQGYLELFANLTPERIAEFSRWVSEDVHFRDPFNDVRGLSKMQAILADMFERTDEPRFRVLEHRLGGDTGFVRWHFSARLPVLGKLNVEGVSRLQFNNDGLISEHLDYWDSAPIYLQLPVMGWVLRRLKGKMALP
ncbi:MAG TPA: nuclear transport factor 2 family protein [Marinobacterium sp.]|nr:nuclear transport factor 2 family protein [Marinobacterium sp.]